jgi:hypothetical protein
MMVSLTILASCLLCCELKNIEKLWTKISYNHICRNAYTFLSVLEVKNSLLSFTEGKINFKSHYY